LARIRGFLTLGDHAPLRNHWDIVPAREWIFSQHFTVDQLAAWPNEGVAGADGCGHLSTSSSFDASNIQAFAIASS
jgi:hypothetical protein